MVADEIVRYSVFWIVSKIYYNEDINKRLEKTEDILEKKIDFYEKFGKEVMENLKKNYPRIEAHIRVYNTYRKEGEQKKEEEQNVLPNVSQ